MSELSWLLDLFLNHKLPTKAKAHVAERLNELAAKINQPVFLPTTFTPQATATVNGVPQAPSTAALMAKHGMAVNTVDLRGVQEPPAQPGIAAATAQTAQAMQARTVALEQALSGKLEPGRTSPRKY